MNNTKKFRLNKLLVASTAGLLLLATLGACAQPTPEATLEPTEAPEITPTETEAPIAEEGPTHTPTYASIESQPFFVQGQVIVYGDPAAIPTAVANAAASAEVDIELASPGEGEAGEETIDAGDNRVVQLYQINAGAATVSQTIDAIHAINDEGSADGVQADPNYHTGTSTLSACGDPFEVAGSPFEVAGSPFEVAGSPQLSGPAIVEDKDIDYWGQWAFDMLMIGPGDLAGEGYAIVIFDTLPQGFNVGEETVSIQNQANELLIMVKKGGGLNLASLALKSEVQDSGAEPIPDHGLVIASLAYSVAEAAEFQLYPVLNEYGCGHLFALVSATHKFVADARERNDLVGAIMNLSLGIPNFSQGIDFENAEGETLESRGVDSNEISKFKEVLTKDVGSLHQAVTRAVNAGIFVVAAAGNEFGGVANLPAAYTEVIGVMAGTNSKSIACYSNEGDILAPGGSALHESDDSCIPRTILCMNLQSNREDCAYGILGKLSQHYGFWSGTSFATPFISGWLARVEIEMGLPATEAVSTLTAEMDY